ncbi:amidase [Brachybacterium paraconglomeratum]
MKEEATLKEEGMHYSSIGVTAQKIRSGELRAATLVEQMLERIAQVDPRLDSFATVNTESATAAAEEADREITAGGWRGPLHGIPIAVKDLYGTVEAPAAFGSAHLADHHFHRDAEVVRRLREAGAIIVGTLRMSEAALTDHGPGLPTPVNPWEESTWVGTSSSGSAAATAAGLCFAALGSDTGGSIRGPATAAGLTGLKPTRGLIPTDGTIPLSRTLDSLGPFARSARDCRIVFDAMAQHEASESVLEESTAMLGALSPVPGRGSLRIGIDRGLLNTVSDEIREMVESTATRFAELGATVEEVTTPDGGQLAYEWVGFVGREALQDLAELYPEGSEHLYGPEIAFVLEQGRKATAQDQQRALAAAQQFTAETDRALAQVDVLLMPTIGVPSPTNAEIATMRESYEVWNTQVMRLTCPYNYSGHPSLTFPTGFTQRGTPMGAQLVGPHHQESLLLSAVEAFQEETGFHLRHPPQYA